jgi:hypothetical protein
LVCGVEVTSLHRDIIRCQSGNTAHGGTMKRAAKSIINKNLTICIQQILNYLDKKINKYDFF